MEAHEELKTFIIGKAKLELDTFVCTLTFIKNTLAKRKIEDATTRSGGIT